MNSGTDDWLIHSCIISTEGIMHATDKIPVIAQFVYKLCYGALFTKTFEPPQYGMHNKITVASLSREITRANALFKGSGIQWYTAGGWKRQWAWHADLTSHTHNILLLSIRWYFRMSDESINTKKGVVLYDQCCQSFNTAWIRRKSHGWA